MKILQTLALALLLSVGAAQAQTPTQAQTSEGYLPYAPAELPSNAPAWMADLERVEEVNYHEIVARFNQYLRDFPEMRRKTPMTKPVLNYFRRWQKTYAPYVDRDGRIRVPRQTDFRALVDSVNAQTRANEASGLRAATPGTEWKLISPIATYDWKTKKMSPAQANIQRIGVSRSNPNVIYCGSETSMVFKSTDKGLHWLPMAKNHYFGGEITTIEVSYTNPDKVIVGAGPILWLTTNGGETWENITPSDMRDVYRRVRDAVFHPENDNIILLGNDAGIYRTTNSGTSWQRVETGQTFDIKLKVDDPQVVYALVRNGYEGIGLRKSTNGGQSFVSKGLGYSGSLASGRIGLSTAKRDGKYIGADYIYIFACRSNYATSHNPLFYGGAPILFKSTNAGESWEINDTINTKLEPFDREGSQGYYDMVITASATDPETILLGLLNLYRSEDGGRTVESVGGYYGRFDLHCDMQDIQVVGDETWLSTDGGVTYSTDFFKAKAEARINGIYASELWGFDMGWNEDVMVGGRYHNGNMSQLDRYNGATISMKGSEIATGYVFLSNPRKIAFSDSENVIMPDDWHDEFVPFLTFWNYPAESTQFGFGFEFDPRYAKSFYILRGDQYSDERKILWKTVDDGDSFVRINEFPHGITGLSVSRSNPDKIVVGTYTHIYYSMDGGKSFEEYKNLPYALANSATYKIVIHPRDENEIWVAAHEPGELYRTRDGGATWEKLDQGLKLADTNESYIPTRFFLTGNDKNAAYAIGIVSRKLNETYNVFRGRILYRDNTTGGWIDYSEGLPPVMTINRMLPFYKDGVVRIATMNGIWQRPLVDSEFRPVAQPLILNVGTGKNTGEADLQFDSYSIVNQKNATWEWTFSPEPLSVSSRTVRNPVVRIAKDQSYDVTLKVTTPGGTDTKTIKKMIVGSKEVPTSAIGYEYLERDVVLSSSVLRVGETLHLVPHGLSTDLRLHLYDGSGRVVTSEMIAPTGEHTLSTSALTPGLYFYHIEGGDFAKTGKLVIR